MMNNVKVEDIFDFATIHKKRHVKVSTYFQDEEGNKFTVKEISKKVEDYVLKELQNTEATAVNNKIHPMINQVMAAAIPSYGGVPISLFLFGASSPRYVISTFGLHVAVLMRLISQKKLKIVTEETPISFEEMQRYLDAEKEMEARFFGAMDGIEGEYDD